MTTWENLFDGYDIYADVLNAYPDLYSQATTQGGIFDLYNQIIIAIPGDFRFLAGVFWNSLLLPLVFLAIFYILFMPVIKKPQQWR